MTDHSQDSEPIVVVELRAENVMRLKAVTIRPNPNDPVVIIGGRNGAGKTSVLNSIWLALGGGQATRAVPVPVHGDNERGEITLDLGRFVVTRSFTAGGRTTLTVTSPDGARYSSPQRFLDEFIGEYTFDPLSFTRMSSREQLDALLALVDLPFNLDRLDAERQAIYDGRTVIGRERDQFVAELAAATPPADNVPDAEVSMTDLLAEHAAMRAVIESNDQIRREVEAQAAAVTYAATAVDNYDVRIDRLRDELAQLETQRDEAARLLTVAHSNLAEAELNAEPLVDPDISTVETAMAAVEDQNRAVRAAAEFRRLSAAVDDAFERYDGETFRIAEIDGKKRQAIAAAVMPLPGLSFDDKQVMFNGLPIQQCSAAEQLRISVAIGMAANPHIRVMCIPDGSLLDDDSMQAIADTAAEHGHQVWIERVGDGDAAGFVIEDGEIRGDPQ